MRVQIDRVARAQASHSPIDALDAGRTTGLRVDVDEHAVELHRPARDLEAPWHPVAEPRDDDRRIHAEDRVSRATMPVSVMSAVPWRRTRGSRSARACAIRRRR